MQARDALALREARAKNLAARDKRERAKTSMILFEARRLNGQLVMMRISRRSKTELTFLCYLPETSLRFEKTITEEMVRCDNDLVLAFFGRLALAIHQFRCSLVQLQGILDREITMRSFGEVTKVAFKELYEASSMQVLADQLFYGVRKGRRIIKMARRGDMAPGVMMFKRGMKFAPGPGYSAEFGKACGSPSPQWKPPTERKTIGDTCVPCCPMRLGTSHLQELPLLTGVCVCAGTLCPCRSSKRTCSRVRFTHPPSSRCRTCCRCGRCWRYSAWRRTHTRRFTREFCTQITGSC